MTGFDQWRHHADGDRRARRRPRPHRGRAGAPQPGYDDARRYPRRHRRGSWATCRPTHPHRRAGWPVRTATSSARSSANWDGEVCRAWILGPGSPVATTPGFAGAPLVEVGLEQAPRGHPTDVELGGDVTQRRMASPGGRAGVADQRDQPCTRRGRRRRSRLARVPSCKIRDATQRTGRRSVRCTTRSSPDVRTRRPAATRRARREVPRRSSPRTARSSSGTRPDASSPTARATSTSSPSRTSPAAAAWDATCWSPSVDG